MERGRRREERKINRTGEESVARVTGEGPVKIACIDIKWQRQITRIIIYYAVHLTANTLISLLLVVSHPFARIFLIG